MLTLSESAAGFVADRHLAILSTPWPDGRIHSVRTDALAQNAGDPPRKASFQPLRVYSAVNVLRFRLH